MSIYRGVFALPRGTASFDRRVVARTVNPKKNMTTNPTGGCRKANVKSDGGRFVVTRSAAGPR